MKLDIEKLKKFEKLPPDVKRQLALYMSKWKEKKKESKIKNDFMAFVKHVWPDFIEGSHHKKVAKKFLCQKCNYSTSRKSSWDKHILTAKQMF